VIARSVRDEAIQSFFMKLDCFAFARNDVPKLILPVGQISLHVFRSSQRSPRPKAATNRVRVQINFANAFKLIWVVQSLARKYSALLLHQFSGISLRPALHRRGVSRSSRTLGAGCDGRVGVARRAMSMRTAKSCGPGTPWLVP